MARSGDLAISRITASCAVARLICVPSDGGTGWFLSGMIFEIVTERMTDNEEIVLVGFGTLTPRPQTQRLARNPKTGVPVMIPARTTVKFKPGKFLLESMNAHLK